MSLTKEYKLPWYHKLLMDILKSGHVPTHLAVIMDGNRRYARKKNLQYISGHHQGFEKLSEVLFWCNEIGIKEVTVYAFSIENFKRTEEEVSGLMQLAENKVQEMLGDIEKLRENGIRIRVLGNTSYLPASLQKKIAQLIVATKDHCERTLNICLSYTSTDEMLRAFRHISDAVSSDIIRPSDICRDILDMAMDSYPSRNPDILIRTSGEIRLSDFLLWQSGFTIIEFIPALWPEFTIWNFYAMILNYQYQKTKIETLHLVYDRVKQKELREINQDSLNRFEEYISDKRQHHMGDMMSGNVTQVKYV